MDFVVLIGSLASLVYGADFIIKQAKRIALYYNISSFIIGAFLVGLGTSLPEMAASIAASAKDEPLFALSNVLGSVLFNITLVLGVVFVIAKHIVPTRDIFLHDSFWIITPVFFFVLMAYDGTIGRAEGVIFLLLMVAYIYFLLLDHRKTLEPNEEFEKESFNAYGSFGLLLIGFVLVLVGAHFVIDSATAIAENFGISKWLIGLFLISFGTSLPELVVSIAAIKHQDFNMSIGNIIGSNVANFSVVLGSAAATQSLNFEVSLYMFDIAAVVVASLMLVFIAAAKLYNKSAGIALLLLLALFILHSGSTL